MTSVHHKSERQDWNTPQVVLELIGPLGGICLDPCSNPRSIVNAACSYSLERGVDGLACDWLEVCTAFADTKGRLSPVFVNPEYSRALPKWIAKCAAEATRGVEIVALVPARTDTRWFQHAYDTAAAIALWRGRIRFLGAPASAPFPSALIYWGSRADLFQSAVESRCNVIRRTVSEAA